MDEIDGMIDRILEHEGGYVDHPADRGGPTNLGVTLPTLTAWLGRDATPGDLRALTRQTAGLIYRRRYFEAPKLALAPAGIHPQLFDIAVNSGPSRAVRLLQETVNHCGFGPVEEDGLMGETTAGEARRAVDALGPRFNNAIVARRRTFYERIVARDPSQSVFLAGWLRRADSFLQPEAPGSD